MRKLTALLLALCLLTSTVACAETVSKSDEYEAIVSAFESSSYKYSADDENQYLCSGFNLDTSFSPDGCMCYMFTRDGSIHIQCDYDIDGLTIEDINEVYALIGMLNSQYYLGKFYIDAENGTAVLGYDIVLYNCDSVATASQIMNALSIGVDMLDTCGSVFSAVINDGKTAEAAFSEFTAETSDSDTAESTDSETVEIPGGETTESIDEETAEATSESGN